MHSPRIILATRPRRHPMVRRMLISRTRSTTDMSMVFSVPTAPTTSAISEVAQAIDRTKRMCIARSA